MAGDVPVKYEGPIEDKESVPDDKRLGKAQSDGRVTIAIPPQTVHPVPKSSTTSSSRSIKRPKCTRLCFFISAAVLALLALVAAVAALAVALTRKSSSGTGNSSTLTPSTLVPSTSGMTTPSSLKTSVVLTSTTNKVVISASTQSASSKRIDTTTSLITSTISPLRTTTIKTTPATTIKTTPTTKTLTTPTTTSAPATTTTTPPALPSCWNVDIKNSSDDCTYFGCLKKAYQCGEDSTPEDWYNMFCRQWAPCQAQFKPEDRATVDCMRRCLVGEVKAKVEQLGDRKSCSDINDIQSTDHPKYLKHCLKDSCKPNYCDIYFKHDEGFGFGCLMNNTALTGAAVFFGIGCSF